MRSQALFYPEAGSFNGPFSIDARLADAISAAGFEGLWTPCGPAKIASLEVGGVFSALTMNVFATNGPDMPLNTYTITVGGTVTTSDPLTLNFANPNLPGGTAPAAYTAIGGDTTTTIATGLAAAINASTALKGVQIGATSNGSLVTIQFPSAVPAPGTSPGAPPPANPTAITATVGGSATETLTVGLGADGQQLTQI